MATGRNKTRVELEWDIIHRAPDWVNSPLRERIIEAMNSPRTPPTDNKHGVHEMGKYRLWVSKTGTHVYEVAKRR